MSDDNISPPKPRASTVNADVTVNNVTVLDEEIVREAAATANDQIAKFAHELSRDFAAAVSESESAEEFYE